MATPPRDLREWMRAVERKLTQAIRTGNSAAVTALNAEAATIREEIAAGAHDARTPAAPTEFTVQSSLAVDSNGRTYGRIFLDFSAVTKATDATNVDVDYYELWGRDETDWDGTPETAPEFKLIDTANTSHFYSQPFAPATTWRFKVRAIGVTTIIPGLWSVDSIVTVLADTTPPPIPSAPVLSQQYSVITIAWDGLSAAGAAQPADFAYTEAAVDQVSSPTKIHTLFLGSGSTVIAGLPQGQPTYIRLRAVDHSGNRSGWSAQRQITPTALVTGDISGLDTTLADQIARSEAAEAAALQSAAEAEQAAIDAAAAQAAATAAQGEADTAAAEAAQSAATAAAANSEAAAARAAADAAEAAAAQSAVDAANADAAAQQALLDLQDTMDNSGKIIRQETAPTGDDANSNNLWIKDSTGESFTWDSVNNLWVLVDNATYAAAAAAADAAADRAEAAEAAAVQAEADAVAAQQAATTASGTATTAQNAAAAAEAAAAASEQRAIDAEAAAAAAQASAASSAADADQALADLQTELGASAKIVRQETAPTGDLQRPGVLWIKDSTGESFTWDDTLAVPAWVAVDNVVIAQMAADADAAADRAEAAEAAAALAQTNASTAEAEATAARTDATAAQTAATNAQNAAVTAQQAADAAEARATSAEAAAAQSAADAEQSMADLQTYIGTSGRTIYQEAEPTGDARNANNLWIKPSDGSSYIFDPAANAGAGAWVVVTNAVVAQAAADADAAADRAAAAEAAAAQAEADALAAQQAASAAEANATSLEASAANAAAAATAAEQRATTAEANAAAAEASADQSLLDVQNLMENSGKIIYQDAVPAVEDQDSNNLWIKDSTGEAFAWDEIQGQWVLVESNTVRDAALAADAAADRAEAAEAAAVVARNDATAARTDATAAQTAATTAQAEAAAAEQRAADAEAAAAASEAAAQSAQASADQSFQDLQGFLDDAGKIMRQETEPTGDDRNANNLWIKDSTGEPYTWDATANAGAGAWVIVTDQRVVQMAADADAAADAAEAAKLASDAAAADAVLAQQDAAASAGSATTAQQAADAAAAAANQSQAEADAAAADAAASAAAAAQSAADADAAAQSAGSSSAAALVAQEQAEAANLAADEAVAVANEAMNAAVNVVRDPGFENGYWMTQNLPARYSIDTAIKRTGTSALKVIGATGTGAVLVAENIPVSSGDTWRGEVWVRTDAAYNGTSSWGKFRISANGGTVFTNATTFPLSVDTWTKVAIEQYIQPGWKDITVQLGSDHTAGTIWFDDVSFTNYTQIKAALASASAAQTAANNANTAAGNAQDTADAALDAATHAGKAFFSADPPSGTAPLNSTWQQYDVDGRIIGSWQQTGGDATTDGGVWTKRQLTSAQFDNFDAGKITFGTMSGARITAGTLTISSAEVPNLPASKITSGSLPPAVTVPGGSVTGTVANATSAGSATNATNVTGSIGAGVSVPGGQVSGTVPVAAVPALPTSRITNLDNKISIYDANGNLLNSWKKTGTTYIDGGQLFTDSVTALAIAANAIEADHILAGAVEAEKLESQLVLTTEIIAGDPLGTHAVMDSNGFRVFAADAADGIPNEVVRMGVAATDDYFAITKADGTLAATISQDGVGSFSEVNANDELYYKGERLSTVLARLPRGPLYKAELSADIDNITSEYGLVEAEYIADGEDRQIELELGFKFYPNQAGDEAYCAIRYTADGSAPTINSARIFDAPLGIISSTSYDSKSFKHTIRPATFVPNYAPGMRLRFLMTVKRGNGASLRLRGGLFTYLYVNDVGPGIAHSPSFSPGGGSNPAPPPPVPAKQNYVRQYGTIYNANYDGNNNRYTFNDNVVFQGLSPAGYGNLKGLCDFDRNAITSDLSGADIQYVRVYFNFQHWYYNSGGTARIGVHGHTGIPGTFSSVGPLSAISSGWPKPGARWVELSSSHWGGFQSGAYCGVYLEGDGTYGTYGYADRPTLEIAYAK